ncbi:hypothetical protein BD289DRAFT_439852 [Coniella lustricola]|uniref:Uncharacterized protein n=1 Tax=Coniella lustricola TaxID=2025994 RepID=A0A2T3A193_9PEZI|nr:hypothetical protein BD289DRAFT_439852 [Coniella lustricola]
MSAISTRRSSDGSNNSNSNSNDSDKTHNHSIPEYHECWTTQFNNHDIDDKLSARGSDDGGSEQQFQDLAADSEIPPGYALRFTLRTPSNPDGRAIQLCFHSHWDLQAKDHRPLLIHFDLDTGVWIGRSHCGPIYGEDTDNDNDNNNNNSNEWQDDAIVVFEMDTIDINALMQDFEPFHFPSSHGLHHQHHNHRQRVSSASPSPGSDLAWDVQRELQDPRSWRQTGPRLWWWWWSVLCDYLPSITRNGRRQHRSRDLADLAVGLLLGLLGYTLCLVVAWTGWQEIVTKQLDSSASRVRSITMHITGPPCPATALHQSIFLFLVQSAQAMLPLALPLQRYQDQPTPLKALNRLGTAMDHLCTTAEASYAPRDSDGEQGRPLGRQDLHKLCLEHYHASKNAWGLLFWDVDLRYDLGKYGRVIEDTIAGASLEISRIQDSFDAMEGNQDYVEMRVVTDHTMIISDLVRGLVIQSGTSAVNWTAVMIMETFMGRLWAWEEQHERTLGSLRHVLEALETMHSHAGYIVDGFQHQASLRDLFQQSARQDISGAIASVKEQSTLLPHNLIPLVRNSIAALGDVSSGLRAAEQNASVFIASTRESWRRTLSLAEQCYFPTMIDLRWDVELASNDIQRVLKRAKEVHKSRFVTD